MNKTDDIEYLVCHAAMLWRKLIFAKVKALGITGTEKRVLCVIERYPGAVQIKIANLLELEPQNLMRALDKLSSSGLIDKKPSADDRRMNCLFVTEKGKQLIQKIQKISDDLKPEIFSGFSNDQLHKLSSALLDVRDNLCRVVSKISE